MNDLIYRKMAIDAVRMYYDEFHEDDPDSVEDVLKALPSAQPERDTGYSDGFSDGYKAGQKETQPEPQWIPCERELPEVGRSVLISVGGMYTAEGCLREDGDWTQFRWDAIQRKDRVGAWKPLEEPWRGESNDRT